MRQPFLDALQRMADRGAIFVFSSHLVRECRASDRPETFVHALDEIRAIYLDMPDPKAEFFLNSHSARELILAERDILDRLENDIETALAPLHFSLGWLDMTDSGSIQYEQIEALEELTRILESELPPGLMAFLLLQLEQAKETQRTLPLDRVASEAQEGLRNFRAELPENLAQLYDVPDEEAAEFLLSRLDPELRANSTEIPKPDFWSNPKNRGTGALAGFAFLLYCLGIVRTRKARSKSRQNRERHFRAQFRDCLHIEAAVVCGRFVTMDKDAARLARAVYAYAGAETMVSHLRPGGTPALTPLTY